MYNDKWFVHYIGTTRPIEYLFIGNQRSTTISLGRTIPDEATDFVASLDGSLHVLEETDAAVIEDALGAGLIDFWEGSIYLHLSTFSPDLIMSILNGDSNNKLLVFLERLLQGNKKLLNYFVGQGTLHFRIQELPNNEFLGSSHGKLKSFFL